LTRCQTLPPLEHSTLSLHDALPISDRARAMAQAADAKIGKGEGGPLAGIPLGIKDLFATKDVRTTACSKILANFVPTYESTITSDRKSTRLNSSHQSSSYAVFCLKK